MPHPVIELFARSAGLQVPATVPDGIISLAIDSQEELLFQEKGNKLIIDYHTNWRLPEDSFLLRALAVIQRTPYVCYPISVGLSPMQKMTLSLCLPESSQANPSEALSQIDLLFNLRESLAYEDA